MFLPDGFHQYEPVLIVAAAVFVVGLIGNLLAFGNRFTNALVTALVVAVILGSLSYLAQQEGHTVPAIYLTGEYAWLGPVLLAAAIVFVVDLIGNAISFSNRFTNALVTALVVAVIYGGAIYVANEMGHPTPTLNDLPSLAPDATPQPTPQ